MPIGKTPYGKGKKKRKEYEFSHMHFQEILLLTKFSRVESIVRANNEVEQVRCKIYTIIEMKVQVEVVAKLDFCKNVYAIWNKRWHN